MEEQNKAQRPKHVPVPSGPFGHLTLPQTQEIDRMKAEFREKMKRTAKGWPKKLRKRGH